LLEKNGKDKSKLENLRPISLSNCDIKLCTKALALRVNKVLPSILSSTQTGYIPGRQVNDNSRLLEELITSCKQKSEQGYLITLDARKAFDSVDHEYLLHILRLFGFPPEFVNNVKMLYNGLESNILVNGYTTEYLNIEQSVKQGDALSCALFIIAIEPLLRQINKNKNIIGFEIKGEEGNFELKHMSFADDITAICRNIEGIQQIIDEYLNFSQYSGIKLNIDKTEILIIGKVTEAPVTFEIDNSITKIKIIDSNKVKICGITFSNDPKIAYQDNIKNKIDKLERQLNIWRQRNLTLEGRNLIVKTFGISQLIYSMQATNILKEELKKIEDIIFRFIWGVKASSRRCNDKIKRKIMYSKQESGGLRAPDIDKINRAIKLKHILRCHNNTHPVAIITNNELRRIGFFPGNFRKTLKSNSTYIQNVVDTNTIMELLLDKDIRVMSAEQSGINSYYYKVIQNHKLENSKLFNVEMNNSISRLKQKGIITINDIRKERLDNKYPSLAMDCHMLYHKIPKEWKLLVDKSRINHSYEIPLISQDINKCKQFNQITQKDIYLRLLGSPFITSINTYLATKHNIQGESIDHAFRNIKKVSKSKILQNIQFKLLHNIYPTQKHLYKWKIKDSPLCHYCGIEENLEHVLFSCEIASRTILNFREILQDMKNTRIEFTFKDILVGFACNQNVTYTLKEKLLIDELIIILKRKLILQRENKRVIEKPELNNMIKEQYNIYKMNKWDTSSWNNVFESDILS